MPPDWSSFFAGAATFCGIAWVRNFLYSILPTSTRSRNERRPIDGREPALSERDWTLPHPATTAEGGSSVLQELLRQKERKIKDVESQLSLERERRRQADAARLEERKQWNAKLQEQARELTNMKDKYDVAVEERKKALEDVSKLTAHTERQYGQLRATRATLSCVQELADTRAQELVEAQTFMGSYDSFTDARIVSDVERLNSQIAQMASTLAAEVVDMDPAAPAGESAVDASRVLRAELGFDVSQYLSHIRHDENPLLLESILQACAVSVISRVISRWHPMDELSGCLEGIFSHLFMKEPASVAGRWRILTRQYVGAAFPSKSDQIDVVLHALTSMLSATLVVAGLAASQGQAKMIVLEHVEVELSDILDLSQELNKSVGDGVVSRSLVPVQAEPGARFDGRTMVDDYARDAPASPEKRIVLCTRGLGLQRLVSGRDGTVETLLLVMPKIVLRSIVDILPKIELEDKVSSSQV